MFFLGEARSSHRLDDYNQILQVPVTPSLDSSLVTPWNKRSE